MQTRRWLGGAALAALLCLLAGPAVAQDDDTRPGGVTFLGDTGLWSLPTAEVLAAGTFAASGQLTTFNREQGLTAIQSLSGTVAVGLGDRAEAFAAVPFRQRIDRDLRPLFQPGHERLGGVVVDFPRATRRFSGNEMGDATVGVKINLMSQRTQAPGALAVRAWARVPTGNEDAGTTLGGLGSGIGVVGSRVREDVEFTVLTEYVRRSDTGGIDLPNGLRWGFGVAGPTRGRYRLFAELTGEALLSDMVTLSQPLVGNDGSLSGLTSAQRRYIDIVLGGQFQRGPVSLAGGFTWTAPHLDRSAVMQANLNADRVGLLVRLGYHPGVPVFVPPPPPPDPPPPNQSPTVSVSCDPCEVEFGDEVRLRADASDPDGDPLQYRWSAPAGSFADPTDRATTRWVAPEQEGPVPVSVTVTDGRGGSGSDTANIRVNAPPPPPRREYVFEDVHFDFDRYNLRAGATRVLDEVVAAMEEDPELRIEIEGHTCNIGTNEYNLALGDRRADSVEEYLTGRGVAADRLQTVSYGEERPEHDNAREETRRLNRRAALVVRLQ